MKFCAQCGSPVTSTVPAGDNRPRFVCTACATIHYENPRVVVGCIPVLGDRILLCRRAIEPRSGYWTMPAGFMEIGETLGEAALRETWEEALARVELGPLIAVVDVVQAAQVHVFFEGTLISPDYGAGAETLETRLVAIPDIPWDELAFPSVRMALERFLQCRQTGDRTVEPTRAPRRTLS
jgi:ADP-ribose pyrophosphatase YjhB (NUDIX family)